MCGIAGWFGEKMDWDARALIDLLQHRGPDSSGLWKDPSGRAELIHTRLAILDPSDAGSQPMLYSNGDDASVLPGQACLVFNGEIYNYLELRAEMEAAGETFSSNSDTEVLLRLLVLEGKAALPKLAGMFAFAFFDSRTGKALLGRDAFGIKPLYYMEKEGSLGFASEGRALRKLVPNERISGSALRDTLLWGSVPEPRTVVESIMQLPAGCLLEWHKGKANIEAWRQLEFNRGPAPSDPVASVREGLMESMERHLISDAPLGIFLSGGIDSTVVLALARKILGPDADIRTLSIGFEDPEIDESRLARRAAEHFGARHTVWRMTSEQGRAEIAGYLEAMDQPSIDGFNTWCISKLARQEGLKVALSGLGGDELFAGYDSFRHLPLFTSLYHGLGPLRSLAAGLLELAPAASRWRRLAGFLRGSGDWLAAFHAQRGMFTEAEAGSLVRAISDSEANVVEWSLQDLPDDSMDIVSYLELTRYMKNQLLRDSDVFSMAHGIELRVPFIDTRLFDAISSIPSKTRLRKGKKLLLEAVPEIPEWVRNQPKRGFSFPFQSWMEGDFGDILSRADEVATTPLATWYRRWALAALLNCSVAR